MAEMQAAIASGGDAPTVASGGGGVMAARGGGGGRGGGGVANGGSAPTMAAGGGGGGMFVGGIVARGGGGGGGDAVSTDTVITQDARTLTIEMGRSKSVYNLDGSSSTVQVRGADATANATWNGDALVIETTSQGPNGPVVSKVTWSLDGESLVRETTRKTFYKKK